MEQSVIFEEKVYLSPKDLNDVAKDSIDGILLKHMRTKLENRCSQHGFVIPRSLTILSRSMGQLENGRFTGNVVFHVQAEGKVYNPANGTRITGTILKKNKMGLYVIYKDAIRILVPRDLHIGNEDFESLDINDTITIEIRKSRFQIRDTFILSVGVFIGREGEGAEATPTSGSTNNQENSSGNSNSEEEEENDDLLGSNGIVNVDNSEEEDEEEDNEEEANEGEENKEEENEEEDEEEDEEEENEGETVD
jgi:DNA-directed RNA polymerase subunit E'/Rpb7